ncbi:adenosylcobinamide-GDP ribazoletransferase [Phormidium sp. CLA17]|nr:adenosylcobinamide-GDP ribazoletransferase [Leptolyngbya sp. Cla-17]
MESEDRAGRSLLPTFLGAIVFYTCIPLPSHWHLKFYGIAEWAPLIGLLIGALLGLTDTGLQQLGMPILVRSALLVVAWVGITGGLHLDGAMDTADGLAVLDPARRLEVMADSRTGAFGAMVAVAIVLLKTTALASLETNRWIYLMAAAGWGRWGQLVAIAQYSYLKLEGKGALHKVAIQSIWQALPSGLMLLGFSGIFVGLHPQQWAGAIGMAAVGSAIAVSTGAWFNQKLDGHTGDTYGAVVEWTETLLLCVLTVTS